MDTLLLTVVVSGKMESGLTGVFANYIRLNKGFEELETQTKYAPSVTCLHEIEYIHLE